VVREEAHPGLAEIFVDVSTNSLGHREIGLDRWIKDHDLPDQEDVFVWQLRLAAERDLPASLHCLQAWGRLLELLQTSPRPQRGSCWHSYGGPREMVAPLAKLGAHFSIPAIRP